MEIIISTNKYDGDYIKKFATSYEKSSKLKMFIQVDDNTFILVKDVHKVNLLNNDYKLFIDTVDSVLVARYSKQL